MAKQLPVEIEDEKLARAFRFVLDEHAPSLVARRGKPKSASVGSGVEVWTEGGVDYLVVKVGSRVLRVALEGA